MAVKHGVLGTSERNAELCIVPKTPRITEILIFVGSGEANPAQNQYSLRNQSFALMMTLHPEVSSFLSQQAHGHRYGGKSHDPAPGRTLSVHAFRWFTSPFFTRD
jgi:hypothetical protein